MNPSNFDEGNLVFYERRFIIRREVIYHFSVGYESLVNELDVLQGELKQELSALRRHFVSRDLHLFEHIDPLHLRDLHCKDLGVVQRVPKLQELESRLATRLFNKIAEHVEELLVRPSS